MTKRYKFISWNVNGIRAVDKKEALKWVDDYNIDILGVQETKSQKDQIPNTIFNKEFSFKTASQSKIKGKVEQPYFQILTLLLIALVLV